MSAGVITTSSHGSDLIPLTGFYIGARYKDFDLEYMDYMDVRSSGRNFERIVKDAGLGLAQKKAQGDQIKLDSMAEVWKHDVFHTVYATGFAVTKEAIDDGIEGRVLKKKARYMAKSFRDTKEEICADLLNNAFSSSVTYGDGKELCATDHPLQSGGTVRNELSTAADLSESALEQAIKDIDLYVDERGLKIHAKPMKVYVHGDERFNAHRILKSNLRVGVADNDANAMKDMGLLPGGFKVLHYLDDSDAWFIKTDLEDGLILFQRHGIELSEHNDDLSKNKIVLGMERYGVSVGEALQIFGSPGAG